MATGYTHGITKDTTFREFAFRCARAFGAFAHQRDQSIDAAPRKLEVDFVALEREVALRRKELMDFERFTETEQREKFRLAQKQHRVAIAELRREMEANKANLLRMTALVKRWKEPTPGHLELKNFMLSQLAESIQHDYLGVARWDFHIWLKNEHESFAYRARYAEEKLEKEHARAKILNGWADEFFASLDRYDAENGDGAAVRTRK